MERRVGDVMHQGVISCHEDTPVGQVAVLMRDHDISSVVVVGTGGELRGIITQSDMVKTLSIRHFERRPWNLLAEHIMTADVITTPPDTLLDDAAALMTERHIHRVVVAAVDAPRQALGVCSMTDIVRTLAEEQ